MSDDNNLSIAGDVQKLSLRHGDIVVVKVPDYLPQESAERLRAFVKGKVPAHDVMVLAGGMDLAVLSRDYCEALGRKVDEAKRETGEGIEQVVRTMRTTSTRTIDEMIEATRVILEEIRRRQRR